MIKVITFGTYDLLHQEQRSPLQRIKEFGGYSLWENLLRYFMRVHFLCFNKVFSGLRRVLFPCICLIINPHFVACTKVEIDIEDDEISLLIDEYKSLSNGISKNDSFIYFTDPHLLGSNNAFDRSIQDNLVSSFAILQKVYLALPISFCLNGGDWLNSGDTQEVAKQKLLFADAFMKSLFMKYYKILGNHDTNYQGIISNENQGRGDFSRDFIDKTYFSETGSAYYVINGEDTVFYVLDSGLDWAPLMNDYKIEQIRWLASQLLENDSLHNVICLHMFYDTSGIVAMSKELIHLCDAYNHKTCFMIQDKEFDYSSTSGEIHVVLTGHLHYDYVDYVGQFNDLPVVGTCNYIQGNTPTFDICFFDYGKGLLNMIRVGQGESRKIRINVVN